MIRDIYPDIYIDSIYDINIEKLKDRGIKGIIFDIDNTLVPMHQKVADKKIIEFLKSFQKMGIKVSIVSNAAKKRVEEFGRELDYQAYHRAWKPARRGLLKAVIHMGISPENIALVGDQIFTDIRGGNRLNMYTILVKPIDNKEIITVRMKRIIEKIVLSRYKQRGLN